MRAKAAGAPRLAPLGAQVYYTHRASTCLAGRDLQDVRGAALRRVRDLVLPYKDGVLRGVTVPLASRVYGSLAAPVRKGKPLHRWVVCWPEVGYGTVTGLTYRAEGWRHEGGLNGYGSPEHDPPYFEEHERYPLYQVRSALTGPTVLAPVWAVVPHLQGWSWGIWQDTVPHVWRNGDASGGDQLPAYVDAWLQHGSRELVA